MLANAKLTYDSARKLEAADEAFYAQARAVLPRLPEYADRANHWFNGDMIVDDRQLEALTALGLALEVSRVRGLAYPPGMPAGAPAPDRVVYQVSVANIGLLAVQRVEVLEDCCTHALQDWLTAGWRIIAVCPPNDARRPTYVVGHSDMEAARG